MQHKITVPALPLHITHMSSHKTNIKHKKAGISLLLLTRQIAVQ